MKKVIVCGLFWFRRKLLNIKKNWDSEIEYEEEEEVLDFGEDYEYDNLLC